MQHLTSSNVNVFKSKICEVAIETMRGQNAAVL